jgi:LacI family transcriptional regulator
MPVTIRDVAKRLNLSITTVSRALDGYDDVAEGTRSLVERTAREMGYEPNRAARQLRRKRSDTIGYILPAHRPQFSDPFFSEFIAGLGDEVARHNFDLLVSASPPEQPEEQALYQRWAFGRKVDGFVLNRLRLYDWRVRFLAENKVPFVSLECSLDPFDQTCVKVDGEKGFRLLVDHLIELGHRRIAFIGGSPNLKLQVDRSKGFQIAMQENDLPLDADLLKEGDLTQESGYKAALALLKMPAPPTAIACVNDQTAIGALHAAHELGYRPGEQLAIAGFDGIIESAYSEPPLTTVNQPIYEIACKLVCLLIDMILGNPVDVSEVQVMPELIVRASTVGDGRRPRME